MDTRYSMASPSRRSEDGFTLAELVVASTLIALVMASVYTIFSTAVQAWRGGESDMDAYHDARIALSRMSQELRAIEETAWYLVSGTDDSIEFYTLTVPMAVEEGLGQRLMRVRYRVRGSRGKKGVSLFREEATVESGLPLNTGRPGDIKISKLKLGKNHIFELVEGVRSFDVSYIWLPPRHRTPGPPPHHVEPIVEKVNKIGFGLPQGIEIRLSVVGEKGESNSSPARLDYKIVFRGPTSPLPTELAARHVGRAG